jgi:carbon-monoxide dehydrogenase medium subunit
MRLKKFEFYNPSSLPETLFLLKRFAGQGKLIAGGTDLLVQMKNRLLAPGKIINLLQVPELKGIDEKNGGLRLGALVNHEQLDKSASIRNGREILSEAARKVGSLQIRHRGTLGGNLCNASPSADTAPALLTLGAEITLASPEGERRLLLESFFLGPGATVLRDDELLKEVCLPPPPPNTRGTYLKLGRRKSLDLALVSVAVLLTLNEDGRTCRRVRVALGGVAPVPLRARNTEKILEGSELEETRIREAAKAASGECRPITDVRASAEYRREMARILTERAIRKCLAPAILSPGIQREE